MSYTADLNPKQVITTSSEPSVVNMASSGRHTAGQSGNLRFVSSGIFTGLAFAAMMAFMNLGSQTTTNQSSFTSSQQPVSPYNSRGKNEDVETEGVSDENIIKVSQALQEYFGFKTAQWAKILKVERKTIYNWKNKTGTRVKYDAAKRIMILSDFAKSFKRDHSLIFSKYIFGSGANVELAKAFTNEFLDISEITDAYYNIYTKIDGAVKRRKLLG